MLGFFKHTYRDVWLIDLGASFHMTLYREWFCKYERYDGGDFFLGDVSITRITGREKVKLMLKDGRIRTLLSILHILVLARNLILGSKMSDASVNTVFEGETYRRLLGAIMLLRGVRTRTL